MLNEMSSKPSSLSQKPNNGLFNKPFQQNQQRQIKQQNREYAIVQFCGNAFDIEFSENDSNSMMVAWQLLCARLSLQTNDFINYDADSHANYYKVFCYSSKLEEEFVMGGTPLDPKPPLEMRSGYNFRYNMFKLKYDIQIKNSKNDTTISEILTSFSPLEKHNIITCMTALKTQDGTNSFIHLIEKNNYFITMTNFCNKLNDNYKKIVLAHLVNFLPDDIAETIKISSIVNYGTISDILSHYDDVIKELMKGKTMGWPDCVTLKKIYETFIVNTAIYRDKIAKPPMVSNDYYNILARLATPLLSLGFKNMQPSYCSIDEIAILDNEKRYIYGALRIELIPKYTYINSEVTEKYFVLQVRYKPFLYTFQNSGMPLTDYDSSTGARLFKKYIMYQEQSKQKVTKEGYSIVVFEYKEYIRELQYLYDRINVILKTFPTIASMEYYVVTSITKSGREVILEKQLTPIEWRKLTYVDETIDTIKRIVATDGQNPQTLLGLIKQNWETFFTRMFVVNSLDSEPKCYVKYNTHLVDEAITKIENKKPKRPV